MLFLFYLFPGGVFEKVIVAFFPFLFYCGTFPSVPEFSVLAGPRLAGRIAVFWWCVNMGENRALDADERIPRRDCVKLG